MSNNVGYYYKILPGDSLSGLATRHGLSSWEAIWNDPNNASFRQNHPTPSSIEVGDRIYIPATYIPPAIFSGSEGLLIVHPVQIISIVFTNAYNELLRNDIDWTNSGTPIGSPTWDHAHSDPVVRYGGNQTTLDVTFDVKGISRSNGINGNVESGSDGDWGFLNHKGSITLNVGSITVHLTGHRIISSNPTFLNDLKLDWKIKTTPGTIHAGSSLHDMYLIYGSPISNSPPMLEDGTTTKRMEAAFSWIMKHSYADSVDILENIFSNLPSYVLSIEMLEIYYPDKKSKLDQNPSLHRRLTAAGWPEYFEDQIGAWPIAEFSEFGAECQAYVRFACGIKNQVGLPGTLERVFLVTKTGDPKTLVFNSTGDSPVGPRSDKDYALVAGGEVVVGNTYDKHSSVQFNAFEAFLKYSIPDGPFTRIAWFGGGLGGKNADYKEVTPTPRVRSTLEPPEWDKRKKQRFKESLLSVFKGLAEVEITTFPDGSVTYKVTNFWRQVRVEL